MKIQKKSSKPQKRIRRVTPNKSSVLLFCLLATVLVCHASCAYVVNPIVQLLAFTLSLPFKVINFTLKLVPYAIRYAPLALLFVKAEDTELQQYYAKTGVSLKTIPINGGINCLVLDLNAVGNKDSLLKDAVKQNQKLIFLKSLEEVEAQKAYQEIYQHMEQSGFYLAYDSRLNLEIIESKELSVGNV